MSRTTGWKKDVFDAPSSALVQVAVDTNEEIAHDKVFEVLSARFLVFDLFIQVAKGLNDGKLDVPKTRRDWLHFQVLPLVAGAGDANAGAIDPFSALHNRFPVTSSRKLLQMLTDPLSVSTILSPDFDPSADTFFYVLDEAQVAGSQHIHAFSDTSFSKARPVLRPIVQELTRQYVKIIVSGTGFSLDLFKSVLASSIGKTPTTWDIHYQIGDFSNQETQFAYISRFFPSPFFHTPRGDLIKSRMYEWLRGRYVEAIVLR